MKVTTATGLSKAESAKTDATAHPVVLDLGKQKRKQVKKLRQGKGKLLDDVNASIQELRTVGNISANGQTVIVIVREKPRKMMRGFGSWL